MPLRNKLTSNESVVCVIGLGYVGLPLAEAFSKTLKVIGFDIDSERLKKVSKNQSNQNLTFTDNAEAIRQADFIVICVPTPVTASREPDLSYVRQAATLAGRNMKKDSVVILESTVYPGVTEEVIRPILEKESGLSCGADFKLAYSPERINPGDREHSLEKIIKIVAGMDEPVTELVADLYRKVTPFIFKAKDIKTAEAAKVIENIQRDLNIALANELAIIFQKIGLNTRDVFEAASTKWNFHRYNPGLVGGYCIPVVPYYLVYKAREAGYHPQVILAGRMINDAMPGQVAAITIKALNNMGKVLKGSRVLVMGLTYKENVADARETPAKALIKELKEYGVEISGFEPQLDTDDLKKEFDIELCHDLEQVKKTRVDAVILTVAHTAFRQLSLRDLKAIQNHDPILVDIPGVFNADEARQAGFFYRTL
ncbi:MAG: UDP-N-acetyl-D-galactosamine dehydrogenase [Chloroflexi bacterium RBG_16_56_11]|nr:MAG: UDP-N-acetyl-D-galactosamine dehydrogenase [Chloroflexi bacterium RBG_16_56_11]